ncbi:hypothetical protein Tco_0196786 [Tanacetum coccineum]
MNDGINGDLGDFLEENDLLPKIDRETLEIIPDSDDEIGIRLEDLGEGIENFWNAQDPVIVQEIKPPLMPQFLGVGNRIHHQNPYNLQITCKIGFLNFNPYIDLIVHVNVISRAYYNKVMSEELAYADISEFVEKGLTEILFGKTFKDCMGLEVDVTQGILWFMTGNEKTIFNMPRASNKFSKLTTAQHNKMAHVLRTSDKDKARGIYHPYQKIKEFYKGCLHLGNEYKRDEEVID